MTSTAKTTTATDLNLSFLTDGETADAADVSTPFNETETNIDEARATLSVSADDTHNKNLEDALSAGTGITLAVQNSAGDENIQISVNGSAVTGIDAGNVATGTLDAARGGLGADASGFSGLIEMSAGVASVATPGTDYVTPTGSETLTNKTLTTPTVGDFTNATHDHEDAAGGGQLTNAAIDSQTATSGHVLTANGAGGASWAAVGGGGAAPIDITVTAGEALAERDIVFVDPSDGQAYKADADAATPLLSSIRGVVNESGGISSAATGSVRIAGEVSGFTGLSAWNIVYAGTTPGGYTQTRPSPTDGGGQVAVVPMGYAVSATNVLVNPGPVTYLKRETLADTASLTITHHADPAGRTRQVSAYVTDEQLKRDLVSWWALDEASGTRADSHGSNNLTDNNTVGSAAGKQGNAASFVAANSEYLSVADNSTLDVNQFALAAWVKLDDLTARRTIAAKYDTSGDNRSWRVVYNDFSDSFQIDVSSDGTSGTITSVSVSNPSAAGTWVFVYAYYDGVNIGISVNNGTASTTAYTSGVFSGAADFLIGSVLVGGSPSEEMNGDIDEVALWGRALAGTEVTELYASGSGLAYGDLTTFDEPAVVGRSSGGTRDVGVRYDDGAGANGATQTTFENTMGSSADLTVGVMLE